MIFLRKHLPMFFQKGEGEINAEKNAGKQISGSNVTIGKTVFPNIPAASLLRFLETCRDFQI